MIIKNLLRRRTRTLLTILGIAIGVAAVLALGSMGEGMARGYDVISSGSGADLLITQSDAADLSISVVDQSVGERIRRYSEVSSVSGVIFSFVKMQKLPYFLIGGYELGSKALQHYKIYQGRGLENSREIILGKQAANALKLKVGNSVKLYDQNFRIVGLFQTGQSFEEGGGVISLADAQAIFKKPRQVTFFQVQLRDPAALEAVKARASREFRDLLISEASGFADKQSSMQMTKAMAWGVAFIAIIIGGLGMMNTMIMAIFERTREIGTLRALGWKRKRVLRQILGESFILSLVGFAVGNLLGSILLRLAASTPEISSILSIQVTWQLVGQAAIAAFGLGLVGGAYPAWRGANLQPIEALSYDGGRDHHSEPSWLVYFGVPMRNLYRRKGRSILTMGGIAIGVAVIVALGAMTEGMIQQMTAVNNASGAHLIAIQKDVADMSYSSIDEQVGQGIRAMPEVESVNGITFGAAQTKDVPFLLVWGVTIDPVVMKHYKIIEGAPISRRGDIMLGKSAADSMKMKVGGTISLPGGLFRVVGIFESGIAYEEGGGVMSLADAQAAFKKPRQVSFYQIRARDVNQVDALQQKIQARFGKKVSVSKVSDFVENSNDIKVWRSITSAIFALALIIGGVGITNTMIMTVMERIREIGTLRALGWRQWQVIKMVVNEAIILSAIAGVFGLVIGVLFAEIINIIPGYAGLFKPAFSPGLMFQSFFVALILGIIGSLYPAWVAGRLSPVEALRYE